MARPRGFDEDAVLDDAVRVFAEHGFEGSSTQELIEATGLGRQSLYNTFGDKWGLYLSALRRYSERSTEAHLAVLAESGTAIAGIEAMIDRIAQDALGGCMGVGAVAEFGVSRSEVTGISALARKDIVAGLRRRVVEAHQAGDIAPDIDVDEAVGFVMTTLAGLRIAARGGATPPQLRAMTKMAMRALR